MTLPVVGNERVADHADQRPTNGALRRHRWGQGNDVPQSPRQEGRDHRDGSDVTRPACGAGRVRCPGLAGGQSRLRIPNLAADHCSRSSTDYRRGLCTLVEANGMTALLGSTDRRDLHKASTANAAAVADSCGFMQLLSRRTCLLRYRHPGACRQAIAGDDDLPPALPPARSI